jgi:tRNA-dihydrouridine synthase B
VTKADGIMIGRAAQGKPWLFREIDHYLKTGEELPEPEPSLIKKILLSHIENLYEFYGNSLGVRIARKHVSWYSKGQAQAARFRDHFNRIETMEEQRDAIETFFA